MAATRVVPSFDIREDGYSRLCFRREAASVDELALEAGKEAFRHRVVVGIAHAAHRRPHAQFLATPAELDARVLPEFNRSSQHGLAIQSVTLDRALRRA